LFFVSFLFWFSLLNKEIETERNRKRQSARVKKEVDLASAMAYGLGRLRAQLATFV
jgi:hypothetical protein